MQIKFMSSLYAWFIINFISSQGRRKDIRTVKIILPILASVLLTCISFLICVFKSKVAKGVYSMTSIYIYDICSNILSLFY
jgi:hypothetical protein